MSIYSRTLAHSSRVLGEVRSDGTCIVVECTGCRPVEGHHARECRHFPPSTEPTLRLTVVASTPYLYDARIRIGKEVADA